MLTADHGEEFHEHGGWWHGTTLYDEQIHVPLIMKPPAGGARGRVVDELTTSLDIAPTILKTAGLAVPPVMQGHALPLDGGAPTKRDSVFSEEDLEGNVLQSVRTNSSKLITANPGNPRGLQPEELYDVKTDPGEQHSLVASEPDLARGAARGARAGRTSRRGRMRARRADRRRQRHQGPPARARLLEVTHVPWARGSLVIGLDGATLDLVAPWAAAGDAARARAA